MLKNIPEKSWFQTPWLLHGSLTAAACLWFLLLGNPFEIQEHQGFDLALKIRSSWNLASAVDPRIVHLDITGSDLASLPDARAEYQAAAQLIKEATELGADLLVFDVLYNRGTSEMSQDILQEIGKSRGAVLAEGSASFPGTSRQEETVRSFPFLEQPYAPAGLINIEADRDGVYRHYTFLRKNGKQAQPSLALAAYFQLKGIQWPGDITFLGRDRIQWRELSEDGIELISKELYAGGERSRDLLDFRKGWDGKGKASFPHWSLGDLHAGYQRYQTSGNREKPLEGKILFVSYVASGVSDFGSTPFGPHQPLVHLHSTALNALLQGTFHRRLPRWLEACVLFSVFALALGSLFLRSKTSLFILWIFGVLAYLFAGFLFILKTPWVLPIFAVTVLWSAAFVGELVRRHTCELVEKLKLRTAMSYYFSPRVLKKVLSRPGSMEPQQVELATLLTDMRNFTPLSEKLGTRGIFDLCNQIFEVETQAVMNEDGSLEHFLGDQFLSYWGAPDPQPDGADRALRAALTLIDGMEKLRRNLSPEIQALFGYGVALHAGPALIGNRGSKQRLDYGVIGDIINSAARVESLTKQYKVLFIMTRDFYQKLSGKPLFRWIDSVLPVGKSVPLDLLEIKHPLSSPHFGSITEEYAKAFDFYRRGDFRTAGPRFHDIYLKYQDATSHVMSERCKTLLDENPKDWNGVYRFTSK